MGACEGYNKGDKVIDNITGYIGTVTGKCDYYGEKPLQYLVENVDSTGRPVEWWIDSTRLKLFKEDK